MLGLLRGMEMGKGLILVTCEEWGNKPLLLIPFSYHTHTYLIPFSFLPSKPQNHHRSFLFHYLSPKPLNKIGLFHMQIREFGYL